MHHDVHMLIYTIIKHVQDHVSIWICSEVSKEQETIFSPGKLSSSKISQALKLTTYVFLPLCNEHVNRVLIAQWPAHLGLFQCFFIVQRIDGAAKGSQGTSSHGSLRWLGRQISEQLMCEHGQHHKIYQATLIIMFDTWGHGGIFLISWLNSSNVVLVTDNIDRRYIRTSAHIKILGYTEPCNLQLW